MDSFNYSDGKIAAIGTDEEILSQYSHDQFERVINAEDKCIIPGEFIF